MNSLSFYHLFSSDEHESLDVYTRMARDLGEMGHYIIITYKNGVLTVSRDIGNNSDAYYSPIKTIAWEDQYNEEQRKFALNQLFWFLDAFTQGVKFEKQLKTY